MRDRLTDVLVVILLATAAYVTGRWTIADAAAAGAPPFFYQEQFAPAVMLACGHGYRNVLGPDDPDLAVFLAQKQDNFDCGLLPVADPARALTAFQGISRYLEAAVATVWRLRGVRWSALTPLFALMLMVTTVATYGLFRLVVGRTVAVAGTLLSAFSPMALANLPNLRDYAKAPFVLGLLCILGSMLRRPQSARSLVAKTIAAGVLEGIGLGFRTDLWLFVPVLVAAVLLAPLTTAQPWRLRAWTAGGFLVVAAAMAFPVLRAYGNGSNTAHVILLGFTAPFDAPLAVEPASYRLGSFYNDDNVYVRVRAFAEREGSSGQLPIGSVEYDRASSRYLEQLVAMVPGDVLTRAWGALFGVVRAPFAPRAGSLSYLRPALRSPLRLRDWLAGWVEWPVPVAAVLGVAFLLIADPLPGLIAVGVFLLLATSATLQFHPRHFFYLEALVWLPALALAAKAARGRTSLPGIKWSGAVAVAAIFLVLPLSAIAATAAARAVQRTRMASIIAGLRAAPRTPITLVGGAGNGSDLLPLPPLRRDDQPLAETLAHPVTAGRYAIVIGGEACDRMSVSPRFRYRSTVPFDDFSEAETIALPLDDSTVTIYRSVFERDEPVAAGRDAHLDSFRRTRFAGIELPPGDCSCIRSIDAIPERAWPEPLTSMIDGGGAPLVQRLSWEKPASHAPHVMASPASLSRRAAVAALRRPLETRLTFLAAESRRVGDGLRVDGAVAGGYSYVASTASRQARPTDLAIVTGTVRSGGITVGLQRNGRWVRALNITETGPFVAVLAPDGADEYQLVIANCLPDASRRNHFSIDRLGWAVTMTVSMSALRQLLFTTGPRSLRASALAILLPALLLVFVYRSAFFTTVPFPPDGHAQISLDEALNWRFCGRPANLSSAHNVAGALQADERLLPRPLREVAAFEAGSLDAYCRSIDETLLNNENSTGLLMRWSLRLVPNLSARQLGRVFALVRLAAILVFAFALLDAGVSIALTSVAVLAAGQMGKDLLVFSYSIYSFFVPLLLMMAGYYGLMLRRLEGGGRRWLWIAALAAGLLTAFCVNMRSSHLPVYLALFLLFVLAARPRAAGRRRWTVAIAGVLFIAGYVAFGRMFISPLVPRAPYNNQSYHVIAHPLVLALAVPDNPLSRREGIVWNDERGIELARRMVPDAVYLGRGYEQGLFLYYLHLWLTYPDQMGNVYLGKFKYAGSGMFSPLSREPMSAEIRRIGSWPNGLELLGLYLVLAILSALLFFRRRSTAVFLFCECSLIATLLLTESGVIMSQFFVHYDGYLLVYTFVLGFVALQAIGDALIGRFLFRGAAL